MYYISSDSVQFDIVEQPKQKQSVN